MSSTFAPSVGRIHIDPAMYPNGSSASAQYQYQKVYDIADALEAMGEGWTVTTKAYDSDDAAWAIMEKTVGTDKAQMGLVYCQDYTWINSANRHGHSTNVNYHLWLCYKPHTQSVNMSSTPSSSLFCGGGFKLAIVHDISAYFYDRQWWFTWLVDGTRVVFLSETANPHNVCGYWAAAEDAILSVYNSGTANWLGGGDITHPQPDVYQELQIARCYPSITPGVDQPTSLQFYKTDGTLNGTYNEGTSTRGEWIGNSIPNAVVPFLREPVAVYKSEINGVWDNLDGLHYNGMKGLIDPDFLCAVNAPDLEVYHRLNTNSLLHVSDGLCVGWDPSYGPMP